MQQMHFPIGKSCLRDASENHVAKFYAPKIELKSTYIKFRTPRIPSKIRIPADLVEKQFGRRVLKFELYIRGKLEEVKGPIVVWT